MDQQAESTAKQSLHPHARTQHAGAAFIGNTGITLIGLATGALLTMVNELLAARFLGIASYGLYGLALLLARIGEKIAVFGVPVSVLRYLPVQLSRGERECALGTVLGGIPLAVSLGLGLAISLRLGGDWLATHGFGQPDAGRWIAILAFAIPLLALVDLLGDITRGFGRALPFILIRNLVPQVSTMAVLVWLLVSDGPQIGVAYGQLCGLALGMAVGALFVLRMVRARIGWVRPVMQFGTLYAYALPVAINSMVSLALSGTDLFMLGIFSSAESVGNYRGCMQIVLVFDLVWNAFAAATATVYTVLIADGERARLQETYVAASRMAILLSTPLLLVIAVNASDILGLLGPAFTAGTAALLVLACGQFTKVALGGASVMLNVGGRQTLEATNVAMAAVVNLALNWVLVPDYGLIGASLSTSMSLIGLGLLRCLQLRRVFGLKTFNNWMLRIALATVPLTAGIWAASIALGFGPGSGALNLVLRLAVMGVSFCVSLWFFCLTVEDRLMLRQLVLRR